ncbi:MAG TPA: response regulator [Candidatus Acidoferrales bacterium]
MATSKAGNSGPLRRPLRLLIVEDSAADAELMVAALKRAGYLVTFDVVDSPVLFEQRLAQADYDVILSDHNLTAWAGTGALELRQRSGKDVPFVVVTGALGDEAAVEYLKRGAADYVLKQRLERLPVAVDHALRDKAHRQEAARLQETIHRGKKEWELTFDTVPDPIFLLDEECRIKRANRAAAQVLGLEFSQLIGKLWYEALHGLGDPRPDCPHERMLATGKQERYDIEEPRLGRIFEVTTTPISDPGGVLRGSVHVMRDITEPKRAEEALRESEARYRKLVENAVYGIYHSKVDGKFLDINPALVAMLGYESEAELLAVNPTTDLYQDPGQRGRLVEEHRQTGRLEGLEVEWKRKDGKPITVRLSGRGVQNEQGALAYFEVIVEDVSERRALEKQLRQAQKFEAIGQLAGGIAHDFNNVIGAMMGWADLGLQEAPAESRLQTHFQKIREQAERAAALTRQLLAFARRQVLEPRNINLNHTVAGVVSLLEKVLGEQIEVKTALSPDLEAARADPTHIEQVLMNLCVNARDAMPRGGRLLIETRNVEFDEKYCRRYVYARPGRYVLLSVSDTGVGMDAATIERIFEPFFTTKEMGKGTGLGLAVVYGNVKQHGGFINVYSEPGQGTTFRVYLPVGNEVAEEREKTATEPVRGGTETILVAEDHEGLRDMARKMLERLGYQVVLAGDGEEAVRMFEEHRDRIALVILDVVLPKLSGPEAYARMCALKPDVSVVFATGYTAEAAQLNSMLEKGAAVLQKPYSPDSLARKVRDILDHARQR